MKQTKDIFFFCEISVAIPPQPLPRGKTPHPRQVHRAQRRGDALEADRLLPAPAHWRLLGGSEGRRLG